MMAAEVSNMTYNHIGISDAFHPLSHHQNDKAKHGEAGRRFRRITRQAFAKFLTKLAAMPDGDGSVLDHSILLYGSNMSNSNAHDEFPLPTLVVGGGCGKLKGGQHLKYPEDTPLANLLLTLLERAGVPVEKLGNSTRRASRRSDECAYGRACRTARASRCSCSRGRNGASAAAGSLLDAAGCGESGDATRALALDREARRRQRAGADGTTALHWAVHHDDLELVERLIRAGANVNAKNDFGATPMSEAAVVGNAELLEALLEAGADVESPNADGQTALMVVARTQQRRCGASCCSSTARTSTRSKSGAGRRR